ncbi:MAG: dimethyl sulfoxide reductase anchor subunit [Anaerolineales bacterium]|nr:dimethyl sulfoxide reductase anchor subunit [Anaerolineales bacterium]
MTYAFTFDSSACSGCKACQEACKDKNQLPVGVLWRRVIEVSGGEWTPQGDAWTNSVFAYNLSLACNHCVHPKCAGVCPTNAYVTRADGIVYIDSSKCMGCGYCAWACPYGVPQYNPELGQMAKCNFCFDNIDVGIPPVCVAACPMRVLGFAEVSSDQSSVVNGQWSELWEVPGTEHPFPLPSISRTEPHLAVKPHVGMNNVLEKRIVNREEIKPEKQKSENSLIVFTLITQMAVGMAVFALFSGPLTVPMLAIFGGLIGVGGLVSLLHLGRPLNAWRAVSHLRKSWLSREILMFGLFGASWIICLIMPGMGKLPLAVFGIGLVYSMARVYRLHVMVTWNTWRTMVGFFITALVTGQLLMMNVLAYETQVTGINLSPVFIRWIWGITLALLACELGLLLSAKEKIHETANRFRVGLIVAAIIGVGIMSITLSQLWIWISLPLFLIVMIEEIIGRWLFYEALHGKIL